MSRRAVFQAGGVAAALGMAGPAAAADKAPSNLSNNVYTRIGVRPFINLTATYTINGGTLTLPQVKAAMEEASHYPVNIDELMEKVGERLAQLLGVEFGIVTAGAAAALVHASAAAVAGADPEKMQQLPDLTGLRREVIIPKQSRNAYDHAIRSVGLRVVEIETPQEFHAALGDDTALVAVLGTGEPKGKIRLEEMAQAAHRIGVPVLVDAAAELPLQPNPYLSRGADMVAYSGGKIIRGPQCAGLLLGRRDLIRAAWLNSSPHHAFGRPMKVGKEEIMGMLAAVEAWVHRDIQKEYRTWESWFEEISAAVTKVAGLSTKLQPPAGASPFPVLHVSWDPSKVGLTAGEVYDLLLNGEPRIMSHASGDGHSFIVRPVAMKPGEQTVVARRLHEIFRAAPAGKSRPAPAAAKANLAGEWVVNLEFVSGSARHTLFFETEGNRLWGSHIGRKHRGDVTGSVDGERVSFRSSMPIEGTRLNYHFHGRIAAGGMSGEVELDEYGKARWSARRKTGHDEKA